MKNTFTTLAITQFDHEYGSSRVPFWMKKYIHLVQGPSGAFLEKAIDRESEDRDVSRIKYEGPIEVLAGWVTQLHDFENEAADAFIDRIWASKSWYEDSAGEEYILTPSDLPDLKQSPAPAAIQIAREDAGLTQTAAADLVQSTCRAWQMWEAGDRRMHPAMWELFLIKTARLAQRKSS